MPSRLRHLAVSARKHAEWFVRDRFPHRRVVRDVQGVRMVLPWSHRLPDYAGNGPYGQNLVQLARLLAEHDGEPVSLLDVGANVGDSTLQICRATDARALCIEADPYYMDYLAANLGDEPGVEIVHALLATGEETAAARTAVRTGGTTRFTEGAAEDAVGSLTPSALRTAYPAFDRLRLAKSDTDGYDVELVPAIAAAWGDVRPVLFFEYDHRLSRLAGNDPLEVWPRLAELGYRDVAVWDNGGALVGRTTVADVPDATGALEEKVGVRAVSYWDVAVVHAEDAAGRAALDELAPPSRRL
ncbi:hypothetical protein [Nocardioides panacisoli]|uniref:hypothetical protein n=1 Tax=Nocardioides panacisoli TaxID=627624 RepID=UPI001F38ACD7|nr:hypothetical protein [Nocardioides panacisoli]